VFVVVVVVVPVVVELLLFPYSYAQISVLVSRVCPNKSYLTKSKFFHESIIFDEVFFKEKSKLSILLNIEFVTFVILFESVALQ
jgi:hypothetical protein